MMHLHCDNCGAAIPGANINIQDKLAACPQCGAVFSFVDQLTHPAPRRKIKQPEGFTFIEKGNSLEIRFRWRQILKAEEHWFTLLCAAGVVVLSRLAYAMYDGLDTIPEGVLGVAFVLGALACLYLVAMILLNQVRITIDERFVQSVHSPLPLGSERVRRADVVRVDCGVASYNKEDPTSEFVDYNVQLLTHDGRKTTLATLRQDLAYYLAQNIEDYLRHDEIPEDAEDYGEDETEDERLTLAQRIEEDAADRSSTGSSQG